MIILTITDSYDDTIEFFKREDGYLWIEIKQETREALELLSKKQAIQLRDWLLQQYPLNVG